MFNTLAYYNTVLHRSFTAYTAEQLGQVGLPFGLLFPIIYVGKHPGCTQAQLTKALGLDWGYSQRCVVKLTEEGFLRRNKQGRAYHLSLLPRGEEAFALGHQVFFDWDRQALARLTEDEQGQLLQLLTKMVGHSPQDERKKEI